MVNLSTFGVQYGGADQSAALQRAAAAGGELVLPDGSGTLLTKRTITLHSGTRLRGSSWAQVVKPWPGMSHAPFRIVADAAGRPAEDVVLSGFQLDGNCYAAKGGAGVEVELSTNVVFEHVKFNAVYDAGIRFLPQVQSSGEATWAYGVLVRNCKFALGKDSPGAGIGIQFGGGEHCTVDGRCDFSFNRVDIFEDSSVGNNVVTGNSFTESGRGIVTYGSRSSYSHNTFDKLHGSALTLRDGNSFTENVVFDLGHTSTAKPAIITFEKPHWRASGSYIAGNDFAAHRDGLTGAVFRDEQLDANGWARGNLFDDNRLKFASRLAGPAWQVSRALNTTTELLTWGE